MPQCITLGNLLNQCAARFTERPFVTEVETNKTITYAEFDALTNRWARGLSWFIVINVN